MQETEFTLHIASEPIEETQMDLLLWRHAEAEDGSPDIRRKLTARGETQARQMAQWITRNAPKNLRVVASPALRCRQTAQALALDFVTDERLGTDSNVAKLLAAVGWPDGGDGGTGHSAILVIGHQPVLGQTAALLLSGQEAGWTVKKAGLWWFSNRTRHGETQTILRAVMAPEFAPEFPTEFTAKIAADGGDH